MTDLLDKIDAGLEEVEEQLLSEFKRLRDTLDPRGVGELDAGIRNALQEVTDLLYTELASSGDRSNLQLLTDRHEVLLARISVLRQLFSARVPLVLLEKAHEGVKDRRRRLEARVMLQRKKDGQAGSSGRSLFDHRPSQQRIARNKIEVTQLEEKSLDSSQVFLDSGIYSASRELSMLASLLRGGTLDRPPEEDMDTSRGRAIFESRELSYRPPPPVDKPRPKQQPAPETDTDTDTDKQEIAQTPEEIRRKLEARRVQVNAGKATFAAKDIEPAFPQEPPRKREKPLEPALEDDQQNEKDKDKETGNKEERKGPAIFEARDLSQTPFKKD